MARNTPCVSSISISSRRRTTAPVTRRATSCCARSRPCCWRACANAIRWRGWAAMDSACCSPIARPTRSLRSPRPSSRRYVTIVLCGKDRPSISARASASCRSARPRPRHPTCCAKPISPVTAPSTAAGIAPISGRRGVHRSARCCAWKTYGPRCAAIWFKSNISAWRSLTPHRHLPEHYELYSRLLNAAGEHTLPSVFIPAAERYRTMDRIDRWVIRAALGHGPRLLAGHDDRLLFINLSATTLADEAWLDFLAEELAQATDSSRQLCFEIKEDVAAQLSGRAARLFDALREMGCRIALDDYGSGALSFSLLKRFAVDYL